MGSCGRLASANVLEDRGDDIGIFDAGDDAQFAAALGACLDVDGEDAFQAPHPGHGGKGLIRLFVARFAFWHDGSRCLRFGANTPWNRVRFDRGRGTNAARRAMKSSGSRTTWSRREAAA